MFAQAKKSKKRHRHNPTGIASVKETAADIADEAADAPEPTVAEARKRLQQQFPVLSKVTRHGTDRIRLRAVSLLIDVFHWQLKSDSAEKLEEGCAPLPPPLTRDESYSCRCIAVAGLLEEVSDIVAQMAR